MHLDPETSDLLFTLLASGALLGLWGLSAVVLPWREKELDRVGEELRSLTDGRAERLPCRGHTTGHDGHRQAA